MNATIRENIKVEFELLPSEEKVAIISHGAAWRLSTLKKRFFLAENKIRLFQEKYQISLADLDSKGLPDNAGYEMHEDYIMWHHWTEVGDKLKEQIALLEPIVSQGLYTTEGLDVGE